MSAPDPSFPTQMSASNTIAQVPCDAGKPHTARLGIYSGSPVLLPRAER